MRYQDIYPSEALLRSFDVVRPRAADLLNLEYFEAEPASMPIEVFDQHHLLLNLKDDPHRVENWRDGEHRDFVYQRNEIVLTPAGMRSGWRWHAKSKVIVVTIEPVHLERFVRLELGLVLSARQLLDVPQAKDTDLVQAACQVLEALRDRSIGSEVIYESLARVLLVKLVAKYGEEHAAAPDFGKGLSAKQYKRVLEHVAAGFGGPLSIEELAGVAGLSPAHFSRVFKEVLGDTPHQFVMDYRIEQAKRMLADSGRSLIDIALACGFADQPHLNRVFKLSTGRTPKEYRLAA